MREVLRTLLAAFLLAAPASAGDAPEKPCKLVGKAFLDMEMDQFGRITVPVSINGVTKQMLVDTGAFETIMTPDAAKELGLTPRESHRGYVVGFGGWANTQTVTVADFRIGNMKGTDFTFYVHKRSVGSTAGLLGMDFLQTFDLDFDFAKAKLTLVDANHCPGIPPYWSRQPYGVIPYRLKNNDIWIEVFLDGQKIRAVLDTGALNTVMSLEKAADAFDLDPVELEKTRQHRFKTLTLGDVAVQNPVINLVKDKESVVMGRWSTDMQMIVGMEVLRSLHLYFSAKEKLIYVTPATQY